MNKNYYDSQPLYKASLGACPPFIFNSSPFNHISSMLTRRILFYAAQNNKKSSLGSILADSNIIVDYQAYNEKGIVPRIVNFFKESNASTELKRNLNGSFVKSEFAKSALEKYHEVCKYYEQRNHRAIFNLTSLNLSSAFKAAVKSKSDDQLAELNWNLLPSANQSKVVMVRVHDKKLSQMRSAERWFQVTCKFTDDKGAESYNVLEKHEKGPGFKFIKFDA